ncbi:DUF11 domain-containing protein [candidate division KSB1 bacterium]|nr:DUF11 domain-containing protein [candidate division KSB1 bacterium]
MRFLRQLSAFFLGCFFFSTLYASEIVLPTGPNGERIYFQANGPSSPLDNGDWWTNEQGGDGWHIFKIVVPSTAATSDFELYIDIWDPESFHTEKNGGDIDERDEEGAHEWDDTVFRLLAPSHPLEGDQEIVEQVYPPIEATSETWQNLAHFPINEYGSGTYHLLTRTAVDDENCFKIRLRDNDPDGQEGTGDEIELFAYQTALQLDQDFDGGGTIDLWFYVQDEEQINLWNFDCDNDATYQYLITPPVGSPVNGIISGEAVWNTGEVELPTSGGDVIQDPATGWWKVTFGVQDSSQWIFYGPEFYTDHYPRHPQLEIEKDDNVNIVKPGQEYTYSIRVTNTGTSPAYHVTVQDTLPDEIFFVSAQQPYALEELEGLTIVSWDIGQLNVGESATRTLTYLVANRMIEEYENCAWSYYQDAFQQSYPPLVDCDRNEIVLGNTIGDWVWLDAHSDSANGIQDSGETGVPGIKVELRRVSNHTVVETNYTDPNGNYIFTQVDPGTYYIFVERPLMYSEEEDTLYYTWQNIGTDDTIDSDVDIDTGYSDPIIVEQGDHQMQWDAGLSYEYVPIELSSFSATVHGNQIKLVWVTESESENAGFYISRSDAYQGPYERLNSVLINGQGNSDTRHTYSFIDDKKLEPGQIYFYQLQDVDFNGHVTTHKAISVVFKGPQDFKLEQNYPNPFNLSTAIEFSLPQQGFVELTIFNNTGQEIRKLVSRQMEMGTYHINWDGRDDHSHVVPSGQYFYSLRVNDKVEIQKMILLK